VHAVTSVLQEIFQKSEQKILQQLRQDFFFGGKEESERREREREKARAENVQGTQKLGNRRQAFNARCDRRRDGRTDGRTDGWMDGRFNAPYDGWML
jgi:hypothetical protein